MSQSLFHASGQDFPPSHIYLSVPQTPNIHLDCTLLSFLYPEYLRTLPPPSQLVTISPPPSLWELYLQTEGKCVNGVAQLIGPSEGALSKVMLSKPLTHEKEEGVPRLSSFPTISAWRKVPETNPVEGWVG